MLAQVWRINEQEKILLPASDQSKFYSGDCYIFQYSYPGEDKEEYSLMFPEFCALNFNTPYCILHFLTNFF